MLTVHRSQRADVLVDALGEVLATPADDPFVPEVVAVPARGVERWVTQRLALRLGAGADRDGIAANIEFPSPGRLVADAVAAAAGVATDEDPWGGERLVWHVLGAVDELASEPDGAVLAHHLGLGAGPEAGYKAGRRYATAYGLARLLRGYAADRPRMLAAWAAGRDTDGTAPLSADLAWQPELYRRVRDRAGMPGPAERLDDACAALRSDPQAVDLPSRLSLFGPTRLAADQLQVLGALAEHRDVHLWLPYPSPALWDALADAPALTTRAELETHAGNELLASLGREALETRLRLRSLEGADVLHPAPPRPGTLLGRLQAAVAADAPLTRQPEAEADGTVELHGCHGAARMVEVLRERLVGAFEDDPSLEPRDVLISCPDIETFAPLIRSAFGTASGDGGHPAGELRVRLADRSLRFTNPVLDVIATVLELADARVTVTDVLDLAAAAPVRARFRFDDGDVERLREWAAEAGARWGLDTASRDRFDLGGFPQNTLAVALDRILLGVAADEGASEWLGTALPLDDVDSVDIDLAGRFADFLAALTRAAHAADRRQPASAWADLLVGTAEELADVPRVDAWQATQARRELAAALEHGGDRDLSLADVRSMLAARLAAKPTRANFRTGELTVCTLVPMRSVPHRLVVLLGLDDEVFPRGGRPGGDDVLGRDPRIGERDRRAEDRQLFLDAVLSATDRLLVFYTGADPVTGTPRPPAVPASELRDAAAVLLGADPGEPVRGLEYRHTLQPFDPGNFAAGAPRSYDAAAYAGAAASIEPTRPARPFLAGPLPTTADDVELDDLVAFCEHPVKAFLKQRLGMRLPEPDKDLADALSIDPDALARWDIGERMLAAAVAGVPYETFAAAEVRRGTLPPYAIGSRLLADIAGDVGELAGATGPYAGCESRTVDVALDLGGGRRLSGSLPGVRGDVLLRASYSRLGPRQRIAGWVRLLALAASDPDAGYRVELVGKGRFRGAATATLSAPENPAEVLAQLVDLRDRGLSEPLPLFPKASPDYAERRLRGDPGAGESAAGVFGGRFGDRTDPAVRYVLGERAFEDAAATASAEEAAWDGEPTRFTALATRLWTPMLRHEKTRW